MVQGAESGGVGAQGYGDMGIGCPGLLEPRDVGTLSQDTHGSGHKG